MLALTGVVTGAAVTGLTSPTYTLSEGQKLAINSKTSYVSAIGGTQSGVSAHSLNKPFTVTFKWPSIPKLVAQAIYNSITGTYSKIPSNDYQLLFRKGFTVAMPNGSLESVLERRVNDKIIAGAENSADLKAFNSFSAGFLFQNASGLFDTHSTGVA